MQDRVLFEKNSAALSRENPELPPLLEKTEAHSSFITQQSKSGHILPCLQREGRSITFHSRFDPVREGSRIAREYKPDNFYIFFGLGGGYHIRPFIERGFSSVIIIETDAALLKSTLYKVDLADLFQNAGVRLLLDFSCREIEEYISNCYIPALMGDLYTVPLRMRIESEGAYYSAAADAVSRVSYRTGSDYLTQARFGRKWFVNTLSNIRHLPHIDQKLPQLDRVIITAAGPSLDCSMDIIMAAQKEMPVLATDTSYPALSAAGIDPDYLLSIDCQHVSYHHFFTPIPKTAAVFLDIASPPLLFRRAGKKFLVESNHPLARYFSRHWLHLPRIDTGGGNVTFAAVSLAAELNAKEIMLYGADFAYPDAKPYANATYFYPYFRNFENRFTPLETQVRSFCYSRAEEYSQTETGTILYTDPRMLRYKEDLQSYINRRKLLLKHCCSNPSLTLAADSADVKKSEYAGKGRRGKTDLRESDCSNASPTFNPQSMLSTYRNDLENMPFPDYSRINAYLSSLDSRSAEVLFTILPGLAFVRRRRAETELKPLFEENYRWSIEAVRRYLDPE